MVKIEISWEIYLRIKGKREFIKIIKRKGGNLKKRKIRKRLNKMRNWEI